jgi:hypothetical protein
MPYLRPIAGAVLFALLLWLLRAMVRHPPMLVSPITRFPMMCECVAASISWMGYLCHYLDVASRWQTSERVAYSA